MGDWKQLERSARKDAQAVWEKYSTDPEGMAQAIQREREKIYKNKDFQYQDQAKEDAFHGFLKRLEDNSHGKMLGSDGKLIDKPGWKHQEGKVYVRTTDKGEAKVGTVEDGLIMSGDMKPYQDLLPKTPAVESRRVRGTSQYNRDAQAELIDDPQRGIKRDNL